MQEDTQIGPLVGPEAVDELHRQVEESTKAGARLLTGKLSGTLHNILYAYFAKYDDFLHFHDFVHSMYNNPCCV